MKRSNYTFKTIILSVMFWLVDSVVHRYIYSENEFELIPSEIYVLWMRIVMFLLLICFGIYADLNTNAILEKEKRIVFNATVSSTQHVLNNLLNQMQLFKMRADESNVFDNKTNVLYEQTIKEGAELIKKLRGVEILTEENIKSSVYPKSE